MDTSKQGKIFKYTNDKLAQNVFTDAEFPAVKINWQGIIYVTLDTGYLKIKAMYLKTMIGFQTLKARIMIQRMRSLHLLAETQHHCQYYSNILPEIDV